MKHNTSFKRKITLEAAELPLKSMAVKQLKLETTDRNSRYSRRHENSSF